MMTKTWSELGKPAGVVGLPPLELPAELVDEVEAELPELLP
jgi:hypothetical protein